MTQRVADYFMEKGLFDKAMEILVRTKKTEEALKLCVLHSVPLTEELVEKMSVPKTDNGRGCMCGSLNYHGNPMQLEIWGLNCGNEIFFRQYS